MKNNYFKKIVTGIFAAGLSVFALTACTNNTLGQTTGSAGSENKVYRTLDEIKESPQYFSTIQRQIVLRSS